MMMTFFAVTFFVNDRRPKNGSAIRLRICGFYGKVELCRYILIIILEMKIPVINNNKPKPIETRDFLINNFVQI